MGGGVASFAELSLVNCTICSNSAFAGLGGFPGLRKGGGLFTTNAASTTCNLRGTLIADNATLLADQPDQAPYHTHGPDVWGVVSSQGHNLIGITNESTGWIDSDLVGGIGSAVLPLDPLLEPLRSNGGQTRCHALQPGSAAIDNGDDAVLDAPLNLTTDQRGYPRKVAGTPDAIPHVDIGAFESGTPVAYSVFGCVALPGFPHSLREILAEISNGDTMNFSPDITGAYIADGELVIDKSINIVGPGASLLTLSGDGTNRVLHITTNATVSISGLTIANGISAYGGGILNEGTLRVSECLIAFNQASALSGFGGGIYSSGTLTVSSSAFLGNSAAFGGGLANAGGLEVLNCSFATNNAVSKGGALYQLGASTLLQSCTIAANTAFDGGAGLGCDIGTAVPDLQNCLVAGNIGFVPDAYGIFHSSGFNLIGVADPNFTAGFGAPGDQIGTPGSPIDPLLGPLQDNGGPTPTMALLWGSPAIDRGISAGAPFDQRGALRSIQTGITNAPGGDGADIGAYEAGYLFLTVSNVNDTGASSLRQAIIDANSFGGPAGITFRIPGAGVQNIAPLSPLPPITARVTIDGYTQPGASPNTWANGENAVLLIELNGSSAGANASGLNLAANNCAVRGLVINRFSGNGISMQVGASNSITGNFIGTDASGSVALGNAGNGVYAETAGNLIGGTNRSDRNVISGNGYAGIQLQGTASSNNVIAGNLIGTDATGISALANTNYGILVFRAAANQIGGGTPAARNVVSGNGYAGVVLGTYASNNLVQGNYAGLGADGVTPVSNAVYGIYLSSASYNLIRSNVSSANYLGCHVIYDGSNIFQGNFIGTDASGTLARGNAHGMSFQYSAGNLVGGTSASERNLISGNSGHGIVIGYAQTSNNVISGNFIGADVTGTNPLGNGWAGITMNDSPNNSIGGDEPGAGNLIRGNGWQGISLYGNGATNNSILGNSIFGNGLLGIDLNGDGVTLNHPGGAVPGPNNLQNFPLLTLVTSGTESIVAGTLDSAARTLYRVEFFASHATHASGYGQGETFIEQTNVVTDASGHASFRLGLVSPIPYGQFLTATCTDPFGNTSEFSRALQPGQAGTLDSTFNSTGVFTHSHSLSFSEQGRAVAVQPDGKIVGVGSIDSTSVSWLFGAIRLSPDGTLDTGFGSGGVTGASLAAVATAVAAQPDGKIVVVGEEGRQINNVEFARFAVARFNSDGSLDTTFNGTGTRLIDFDLPGANADARPNAVVLRSDGRILVAGVVYTNYSAAWDFGLAQLNPDGTLDTAFGPDHSGTVRTTLSLPFDGATSAAIQPDGRAVVAGYASSMIQPALVGSTFAAVRYNLDGSVDQAASFDFSDGNAYCTGVAIQPDGKILLGGAAVSPRGTGDFALLRMNPDGIADTSFGTTGKSFLDFGGGFDDEALAIALQSDGRVILVGCSGLTGLALARFQPDGSPDLSFGPYGSAQGAAVIAPCPAGFTYVPRPRTAALDGDGRVVTIGTDYYFSSILFTRWCPGEYPFHGAPLAIPGTIEAEDYDNGGPGVAYLDTTVNVNDATGAYQSNYRPGSGVDLETDSDGGNNVHVAYIHAGEWLQYTVYVAGSGLYNVQARVASAGPGGTFHLELDGVNKTGPVPIPDTGGWLAFQSITMPSLLLAGGQHSLRIVFDSNGANGVFVGNLNYLTFVAVSPPALRIQLAGNQIVISWPTSAPGFVLQSAPSLLPPVLWADVSQTPGIVGSDYTVVLPSGTGPQFFRLVYR
jgi:uncharacterized delta-60 repeat protein